MQVALPASWGILLLASCSQPLRPRCRLNSAPSPSFQARRESNQQHLTSPHPVFELWWLRLSLGRSQAHVIVNKTAIVANLGSVTNPGTYLLVVTDRSSSARSMYDRRGRCDWPTGATGATGQPASGSSEPWRYGRNGFHRCKGCNGRHWSHGITGATGVTGATGLQGNWQHGCYWNRRRSGATGATADWRHGQSAALWTSPNSMH